VHNPISAAPCHVGKTRRKANERKRNPPPMSTAVISAYNSGPFTGTGLHRMHTQNNRYRQVLRPV
jgi:hypothetical protein